MKLQTQPLGIARRASYGVISIVNYGSYIGDSSAKIHWYSQSCCHPHHHTQVYFGVNTAVYGECFDLHL
jgi:hypothetical protein